MERGTGPGMPSSTGRYIPPSRRAPSQQQEGIERGAASSAARNSASPVQSRPHQGSEDRVRESISRCYDEGICPNGLELGVVVEDEEGRRFVVDETVDNIKVTWLKERTVILIFQEEARNLSRQVKEDLIRAYEDGWMPQQIFDPDTRRGRIRFEGQNVVSYVAKVKEVADWMLRSKEAKLKLGNKEYITTFKPWMPRQELRDRKLQEAERNFWIVALRVQLDTYYYLGEAVRGMFGEVLEMHPPEYDRTRPKLMNVKMDMHPDARFNVDDVLQMVELRHPFDEAAPTASTTAGMLDYARLYYEDILTTRRPQDNIHTDLTRISSLWEDTQARLPLPAKLDLDRPLTFEETTQTLKSMAKDKAPRIDGLTVVFYSKCWGAVGQPLVELYNEVLMGGRLGKKMTHGVISVLFKKGDKAEVRNWRPISLLNVSYKILAKTLARRLGRYLPELVEKDQGAFVQGRSIFNNIATAIEVLEVVQSENLDTTVLLLDLEKAYDKPDGVQRGLIAEIISRFEKKGFYLRGMKLMDVKKALGEQHYAEHEGKPFFPGLVKYICSGPVVAMVWEGPNVVASGRQMIGATKPHESAAGTIRGDYALTVGRNLIHGSDAVESAKKEIALWFPEGLSQWKSCQHPWIYE
ncbi:hypothetical protein CBR_g41813 [Chara braunii]|uniref:nucleoside-diphosphate kinase n=1 Tax=Chara braunii TaxID=69332 RepID=A0A388LX09_CHABU|nr:hypothetical protein CBR_g41813 [Chara braunii]|eukprot:GBG86749.1 hypothetical protein CBR_g41813 [Chara braunii]